MGRHSDNRALLVSLAMFDCPWPVTDKSTSPAMHRRIHTGDKPLKCPICLKAFSESSNLSKHKRTHEERGRFTCTELGCNRSFHRLDQLRRHQKLHTTVKKTKPGGLGTHLTSSAAAGIMSPGLGEGQDQGQATQKKRSRLQGVIESMGNFGDA